MDHADHDLDLAVELINTYWVLASPPDKLTDIGVYQRILGPDDLGELLVLRSQLGPVFAAGTVQAAVGIPNPMLRDTVTAQLAPGNGTARWTPAAGQQGMTALHACSPPWPSTWSATSPVPNPSSDTEKLCTRTCDTVTS